MWKWITFIVIVLLISAAVYASVMQAQPVDVGVVHRGTISAFVEEQARTRLPRTYLVTMPMDGRILPITLQEGDRVTKGEVIARMDAADLETAVAVAQARVRRLNASITENNDTRLETTLREGIDHELIALDRTVEAAEAKTLASKARESFRTADLARLREAFSSNAASELEVEAAELSDIESRVDTRMDVLILRAIEALRAAARIGPRAVAQYIDKKSLTEAVLEHEVSEAQVALAQADRNLERATITAPVDGVVLARAVSNQRVLPAGQVLLEIGHLEDLEIETDVLSQEAVTIVEGDRVEIIGPSIGKLPVSAVVRRVEPRGFTKISSLGVEQQRVRVVVGFNPEALPALGVGYRVRVRIHTDEAEDAVIVPRSALFRGPAAGWQAFVVRGGRARIVNLTIGLMNDIEAQVLSGLDDGDKVILAPETSLGDGQRVEAR